MPRKFRKNGSSRFESASLKGERSSTKLHALMMEAKRIRIAHASGNLTAEEAAEKLAELYNIHRFKMYRRRPSLLSA